MPEDALVPQDRGLAEHDGQRPHSAVLQREAPDARVVDLRLRLRSHPLHVFYVQQLTNTRPRS